MKIFIGWSLETSKKIAESLKSFLKDVIQAIDPIISLDIIPGQSWRQELNRMLEESRMAILCFTTENVNSPWLYFEAGAIIKKFEDTSVFPYLFCLQTRELNGLKQGPLGDLQFTEATQDGTLDLVLALNKGLVNNSLEEEDLKRSFYKSWPEFEEILNKIRIDMNERSKQKSSLASLVDKLDYIALTVDFIEQDKAIDVARYALKITCQNLGAMFAELYVHTNTGEQGYESPGEITHRLERIIGEPKDFIENCRIKKSGEYTISKQPPGVFTFVAEHREKIWLHEVELLNEIAIKLREAVNKEEINENQAKLKNLAGGIEVDLKYYNFYYKTYSIITIPLFHTVKIEGLRREREDLWGIFNIEWEKREKITITDFDYLCKLARSLMSLFRKANETKLTKAETNEKVSDFVLG